MKHLAGIALALISVQARAEPPRRVDATELCRWVAAGSDFRYQDNFEADFRAVVSADTLHSIFEKITRAHGDCSKAAHLRERFSIASDFDYELTLADRQSALFTMIPSAASGKITGFYYHGLLAPPARMRFEERRVTMRDGIQLRTLVFTPTDAPVARPTVLTRTPYFNLHGRFDVNKLRTAAYFVERGYAYVLQSIRGTHGSGGEALLFNPQEIADGADTVHWIAEQAFSNGRVGAVGTSYEGLTAVAAGVENPAGLAVIVAGAGPTDSASGTFNARGLFSLHALGYIKYFTQGEGQPFDPPYLAQKIKNTVAQEFDLRRYDELIYGQAIPEWKRWAGAWADLGDPFWSQRSFLRELPRIHVPTYHWAGLRHDGNMPDTVNNFTEIERHSPYRSFHHLLLGYWDHAGNTPAGDGSNMTPSLQQRFDALLAYHLKGEPTAYAHEPRVQMPSHFVEKEYIGGEVFPLTGFTPHVLYLSDQARLLESQDSPAGAFSSYEYDPTADAEQATGLDFNYTASQELKLNGLAKLDLYLQIDVPQTDVYVTLWRVDRDGKALFASSCSFGQRLQRAQAIEFHSVACPVFQKIAPGETLRIGIYSTGFPNFARNTNNAPGIFWETPRTAHIRVLHDAEHPSRLSFETEDAP